MKKKAKPPRDRLKPIFQGKQVKKSLSCRLSPKALELIEHASNHYGLSFSEVIESCVKHTLENEEE